MTSERTIALQDSPQKALQKSVRALQMAGYKKIQTDAGAGVVSSFKFKTGQWTRTGISITIMPVDGGVEATVSATAHAHSLSLLSVASRRRRADPCQGRAHALHLRSLLRARAVRAL